MKNGILTAAVTLLLGRSRKLRWLAPAIPLALTAFKMFQQRQAAKVPVAARPAVGR